MKRLLLRSLIAAAVFASSLAPAHAQPRLSEASVALSVLPVAISVAAPAMLVSGVLSGAAALTVVGIEASANGAVWVLERASDGARMSVKLGAQAAGGLSMAAGTAVLCTAMSTGWVLSTAGKAIAFIPNEIGAALLYNERVTR